MRQKVSFLTSLTLLLALSLLLCPKNTNGALRSRHRAVIDSPDVKEKPPLNNKLRKLLEKPKKVVNNFVTPTPKNEPGDTINNVQETSKLKKYYDKRSAQVKKLNHPDHKLKSGIFGKLAFYSGLLTILTLLLAFVISSPTLATLDAALYTAGFLGGIVFGLIGITRRKKRGKAIIGLSIIILQIMLFAAIASLASAIATAAPVLFDVMVVLMLLGKGG